MAYQFSNSKAGKSVAKTSSGISTPEDGPKSKGLATLLLVVIIVAGGLFLVFNYTDISLGSGSELAKLDAEWQAVFLTNGQVYFGKVDEINEKSVILKDIYYLQVVNRPLQTSQQAGEAVTQPAAGTADQRLTLIKLGNEIHGPQDEMVINRDQVVIMENLKDDSRVVQAINDYLGSQ